MIRLNCPSCGIAVSAPEDCAGRSTECRNCNHLIGVSKSTEQWRIQQRPALAPPPSARPSPSKDDVSISLSTIHAQVPLVKRPSHSGVASIPRKLAKIAEVLLFVFAIGGMFGLVFYACWQSNENPETDNSLAARVQPQITIDSNPAPPEQPPRKQPSADELDEELLLIPPPLVRSQQPRLNKPSSTTTPDEVSPRRPLSRSEAAKAPTDRAKDEVPSHISAKAPKSHQPQQTPRQKPVARTRSDPAPDRSDEIARREAKAPVNKERTSEGEKNKDKPRSLALDSILDDAPSNPNVAVKPRRRATAEELRNQLLFVPEIGLNQETATAMYDLIKPYQMTIVGSRTITTASFPSPDPAADFGPKYFISLAKRQGTPELAYLPWRQGPDCHLGKELAENLNDLSLHLRNCLRAATPVGAVRPDLDTLRRLMFAGHGTVNAAEWQQPAAIPALVQLLQVENTPLRVFLVELLARIEGKEASEALAQRSLFDLSSEVRKRAIEALNRRPFDEYQKVILAGFRYPWPAVADHAADALVGVKDLALKDKSLVPRMIELMGEPDPRLPVMVEAKGGKKVLAARELVRINHMSNCMLCHAPSTSKKDLVRGRVPIPNEDPPPLYYADQSQGEFVRADMTYLRQDFSVVQPVARSGKWPGEQRFDYLTRVRPLSKKERTEFEKQQKENRNPDIYEQKKALLFAIRELTRKDLDFTYGDGKPILNGDAVKEDKASRQGIQP